MHNPEKIKLLIVDDCKLTTVGLKTMLKAQDDIEIVDIAENGQVAVAMTEKLKPDVILMDIGMPIMDGIEATKIIKKRFLDTKIIMLTSHDSEKDVFDALSAGASSYCMKDIQPSELINVIKTTHNGASWLDPHIAQMVLSGLNSHQFLKEKKSELTEREIEILTLISKGFTNTQISETLYISMNTVKTHIKNIFQKLEVNDRTEAAMKALKEEML